jgi:hypothetical protein
MLIIADHRIPEQAKKMLSAFGELLLVKTKNLVYDAISGHPDIFFCQVGNKLIVSPGLPETIFKKLKDHHIDFIIGKQNPGMKYPSSARYNVVCSDKYLIHNPRSVELEIVEKTRQHLLINVKQAYVRCNLLPLKNDTFITSDMGIYKTLEPITEKVLFVHAKGILLPGFEHGFFGGACGVLDDKVFILGNLAKYPEGKSVRTFLQDQNYNIIELYDGPLFDGGSLFFVYGV